MCNTFLKIIILKKIPQSQNSSILINYYVNLAKKDLIVFGGASYYLENDQFYIYDSLKKCWNEYDEKIKFPVDCKYSKMFIDIDNSIYLLTGRDGKGESYNFFKLVGNKIYNLKSTILPRIHMAMVECNNKFYVFGGYIQGKTDDEDYDLDSIEIYDINTDTWTFSKAKMSIKRHALSAVTLLNDKILIMGGSDFNISNDVFDLCEIYDPITDSITIAAPMLINSAEHYSCLFPNGHVLVFGGFNTEYFSMNTFQDYNPYTNKWQEIASGIPDYIYGVMDCIYNNNTNKFIVVFHEINWSGKPKIVGIHNSSYDYLQDVWEIY